MARIRSIKLLVATTLVGVLLWGCGGPTTAPVNDSEATHSAEDNHAQPESVVEMPHLHGIGYSTDGTQLFVAAHIGLITYSNNSWQKFDGPTHDYMGYAPTDTGFYSSGHPAPNASLPNPLGLVKSTDGGQTLTTLAFSGESDFHTMAVGYQSHAIYVVNSMPNSQIGTGLFYSLDDGANWEQSAAQGTGGQPIQLVAHPTEAAVVALVTNAGLFLSTDHGKTFELIHSAQDSLISAASFDPTGATLFYGGTELSAYDLTTKHTALLKQPNLGPRDTFSYLAVNPVNSQEITLATNARNIYRTQDGAETWQQIAAEGRGID